MKKIDFYFMGPQGPWSGPYVENNKLMITFFAKLDFSRFFIGVINGSGVSFGQVTNLEFIPHHMTALPVHMCLDFQASYNFERRKRLFAYPFDHELWIPPCRLRWFPRYLVHPNQPLTPTQDNVAFFQHLKASEN